MESQECVVCGVGLLNEDPRVLVLSGITKYTGTPLKEVVGSALQQKLKTTDFICQKCFELFNEKDRFQKMTTDVDSHIMTKIKDSSKKTVDNEGTISIIVGLESFTNENIKEELERQYNNIKDELSDSKPLTLMTEDKVEPPTVAPKRRRGRPPKVAKRKKSEESICEPPPLMVNQREKRKRSTKFNTFLEVLKGEKDFYIEDEDVEEPKTKKRGGGRKKKTAILGIVPVEDKLKDDEMDKMCIIQVTDLDVQDREIHATEKDRLDLDEVVQEILGINTVPETELIHDIDNLGHDGDLINAIDEMNSHHEERTENYDNLRKIVPSQVGKLEIKQEEMEIDNIWSDVKADIKPVFGELSKPSIEVAEIEEDLAASMPSLEVTITHSEDNTLRAVINDPDVLSAIVQEDSTDTLVAAIKQEVGCDNVMSDQKKYRCKLCSEIFFCKDKARKHAQECHSEIDLTKIYKNNVESFKCSDCDRTFPTLRGRDRHHLHMHLKHKPVQCTECFRTFNSFRPLERHLRNNHDKDPTLFCEMCEAEFVLGTSLEHHKEIMHPVASRSKLIKVPTGSKVREQVKPNRMFECPFCNQEIYGARALRLHHQKMHNSQEYTCKYCKYKSACLSTMHRHMVRVHKALNLKLYYCLKCMAGYQDPRDLEEHYISVHKTETSFLCQHCGEKFACIDMLRFHRNSHRAFSCKLCHLGFMKEEALEDHMKAVHTCDPVRSNENGDITGQSEGKGVNEKLAQLDEDADGNSKVDCTTAASSKVLVIASDGTVQVKDEGKEVSAIPTTPSEDITLHLQQTREGGLEEMDMLNPLKGQRVKDLPKKMNCPVCNKVLTTKFLKTHMLSHKGNLPHKCHVCDKAYAQGTLLRKHMKNRHYEEFLKLGNKNPKKHKIGCDFCQEIYDNIYALEEHLWLHMDEKTYECTDCKIKFGMSSNLREHYKSHFFKEAQPCPVCKREFKSIGYFNEHVERCQKRWKCEQCGLECDTQEYYRKHQRCEHGGENVVRYQCNLCEKSFVERYCYDDHMITHSSEKAFTCHICQKQFKRKRPLNDHLVRAHSDGQPVCSYCRKTFPTQQELDLHKRKHRKEFPCISCNHVYTSKEALTNHLMVHHSEASHSCQLCGQSFVKQVNLKGHLITHNSNTPHICHVDDCHKMFRTETLLRNHVARRHHELQYDCPICDRKFGLESDQIRHMATHSTGAALPCGECDRTFRSEAQLVRHLLTHTQEKPYECGVCQHTANTRHQILRHIQGEHGLTDAAPHIVVNRWRCSVCGKMFVGRGSLLRHLQDHATHGVQAQGHAVKTRSTPSTFSKFSLTSGIMDPTTATNSFLDQVSGLSWQDLTPLLRLHVMADEETGEGETAAVAADVWQCPGCLHATQTEEDMRDHLVGTAQCQEAVILQLAGGLVSTDDLDEDGNTEEQQVLDDEGNGAVLQLTGSDGGMQYVIVQEGDGHTQRLSEGGKEGQSVQEGDGGMQMLVSMGDSFQHLLQQPAHPDIQIVVEDSAPLKQLFVENGGEGERPTTTVGATSTSEGHDIVPADTPLLNGSEVLLQTADGQLVLQQTVGGVTQYQLVEGVPTAGEEDSSSALLPSHPPTLHTEFMLPEDT
ncbi:zinc finger protein 91-like [Homarus americanus]|uniref:Zinc finger protein 91-like 2 n=1 Tax=Homarus americanus TaxID=6706 RepID=A0A8J5JAC8_HOMAM|nr:zinc finger protein 91-like [Homarus americanus]KAG7154620.1 Zinc finger protein 91-like 2 [Homarus americanus]